MALRIYLGAVANLPKAHKYRPALATLVWQLTSAKSCIKGMLILIFVLPITLAYILPTFCHLQRKFYWINRFNQSSKNPCVTTPPCNLCWLAYLLWSPRRFPFIVENIQGKCHSLQFPLAFGIFVGSAHCRSWNCLRSKTPISLKIELELK